MCYGPQALMSVEETKHYMTFGYMPQPEPTQPSSLQQCNDFRETYHQEFQEALAVQQMPAPDALE